MGDKALDIHLATILVKLEIFRSEFLDGVQEDDAVFFGVDRDELRDNGSADEAGSVKERIMNVRSCGIKEVSTAFADHQLLFIVLPKISRG